MKVTMSTIRGRKAFSGRRLETKFGESIVFLSFKGETILDNLANRRTRPHTQLKPLVAKELSKNGIKFEKLAWSKNAGCTMCPCSPGFIIKNGDVGNDMWVEVA